MLEQSRRKCQRISTIMLSNHKTHHQHAPYLWKLLIYQFFLVLNHNISTAKITHYKQAFMHTSNIKKHLHTYQNASKQQNKIANYVVPGIGAHPSEKT